MSTYIKKQLNTKYPVKERNKLLVDFFEYHNFKNVKLIGDENQPKIILDDMLSVSGFVRNKIYNFTNKQFGGEIIHSIDLNQFEKESHQHLKEIINSAERKRVYRLKIYNQQLFYVRTVENAPYFSNIESRYFFDFEKAVSTQQYLSTIHKFSVDVV